MKSAELREQILTIIAKFNMQPSEILMVLNEAKEIINTLNEKTNQPKVENKDKKDILSKIITNALKNSDNVQVDIVPVDMLEFINAYDIRVNIRDDLKLIGELL